MATNSLKNVVQREDDFLSQIGPVHDVNALKHQVFVASRTTINEQEYRYDEKEEKRHVKEVY